MALKKYKPTTPGQRQLVNIDRSELWKGEPLKALTFGLRKSGGRNHHGRTTNWNTGGGHKRRYRIIDFRRDKYDIEGVVERIEYDPNRSSFIALVKYADSEYRYIIAPQRLQVGDKVIAGDKTDVKPGNSMQLRNMPVGTIVHNVEMKVGKGGQIARSAGTYAQIQNYVVNTAGKFLVRFASLKLSAAQRLVRCQILTIKTVHMVRLAVVVGSVFVQRFVVLP